MKTTLNIDDKVMNQLRMEAARQGRTMSDLMETALRRLLEQGGQAAARTLKPLPTFNGGAELVDIANRDALYSAMEG